MQYINTFIYELGLKEPNLDKRKKIGELELWNNEWERVKLFLDLLAVSIALHLAFEWWAGINIVKLKHADNAQQAFSSDQNPSLHLAIPALEVLHKAWSSRLVRPKYYHFKAPLRAAIDKIVDYYEKTGDSDAYIIAMCEYSFEAGSMTDWISQQYLIPTRKWTISRSTGTRICNKKHSKVLNVS